MNISQWLELLKEAKDKFGNVELGSPPIGVEHFLYTKIEEYESKQKLETPEENIS
jgi:hypothetical protein